MIVYIFHPHGIVRKNLYWYLPAGTGDLYFPDAIHARLQQQHILPAQ